MDRTDRTMNASLTRRRLSAWALAAGWTALIYSTLSLVRPACEFLKARTPFAVIINAALLAVLAAVVFAARRQLFTRRGVWLAVAILLYLGGLWVLKVPEEKIHFLEYGLLAVLVYRAVRMDAGAVRAYIAAFLITCLLGWADEGIQHLLPSRYFQWNDVALNCLSAAIGLMTVGVFGETKGRG